MAPQSQEICGLKPITIGDNDMMVPPTGSQEVFKTFTSDASTEDNKPIFKYFDTRTASTTFESEDELNKWWESVKNEKPFNELISERPAPCECVLKLTLDHFKKKYMIDQILEEAGVKCKGIPPTPSFRYIDPHHVTASSRSEKKLLQWWYRVKDKKPFNNFVADREGDNPHTCRLSVSLGQQNEGKTVSKIFSPTSFDISGSPE